MRLALSLTSSTRSGSFCLTLASGTTIEIVARQAPWPSRMGAAMQATEKSDSPAWMESPCSSAAAALRASCSLLVSARPVGDTVAERRSAALLNGKPVVGFEITRSRGAGEVEVAQAVKVKLAELKAQHPDITITEAFNFVDPVEENFHGSMYLLYEGAALAVIVVFFFLRDWRATLVSAAALPLGSVSKTVLPCPIATG